jgi:hypothetical protein
MGGAGGRLADPEDGLRSGWPAWSPGVSIARMPRVVVLGLRPFHLSAAEADAWLAAESARLLEIDGVVRAELTSIEAASDRFVAPSDWMIELHLAEGGDGYATVEDPRCADWLGDLRLLGMRPAVFLLDVSRPLGPAGR